MNATATEPQPTGRWLFPTLVGLIVLAIAGAATLAAIRKHRESRERGERAEVVDRGTPVLVVKAQPGPPEITVSLPGEVRGFLQVTLYAKLTGYLTSLSIERGDRVKAHAVLGQLESPETDQELIAAQADLINKRRAAERARALASSRLVSTQELDNANSVLEVAEASAQRLKALKEYEVLRAPFDGIVTARYVDPGALIQGASPILDVSELRRLRILVYVGQDAAPFVKVGTPATVIEDARPDRPRKAQVNRIARALDPRSRTMLCEIWLDNPEEDLYPGSFIHVTLHVPAPPFPTIPAEALFTRAGNPLVPVVDAEQRLVFRPVETGWTDGKVIQIRSGLQGGETVVVGLPSELGEGAHVQPKPLPAPKR